MTILVGLDSSSSVLPDYGGGQGDSKSTSSDDECIRAYRPPGERLARR